MPDFHLAPMAPFAGLPPLGASVLATDRDGCGIALCSVRRGRRAEFEQAIKNRVGAALPGPGRCVRAGKLLIASVGPEAWLFVHDSGPNQFAIELRDAVKELASVVDQSDGYALLCLAGRDVARLISAGASIDMSEQAFPIDRVATTQIAHIPVTVWRKPDDRESGPTYEMSVLRSFAASFWEWLVVHTKH